MSECFHLFERFGVELEYMIVNRRTLDVLPVADRVLHAVAGAYESEVEMGALSWSNELALHVIELKTNGPATSLAGLAAAFQKDVVRINELLEPLGGMLMPTAMHPWMDPHTEMRLWPHEYSPVYEAFDRVFDCRGHGWSNLQSAHVNLPFSGDEEFGRLHAAIRLVLPALPALAASSPMMDGTITGLMDTRLDVYRHNARRVPSVSGRVIPEAAYTRRDYEERILRPLYRDIAPHDPDGTLQFEWLNARGAIARFDRNTIEIRTLDVQECPLADLALLRLIVSALRGLIDERWCAAARQYEWPVEPLADLLLRTTREGERAVIDDPAYLAAFGLDDHTSCTAGEFWRHLHDDLMATDRQIESETDATHTILDQGCLSRRLLRALGDQPDRSRQTEVYERLCHCLAEGRMFREQ